MSMGFSDATVQRTSISEIAGTGPVSTLSDIETRTDAVAQPTFKEAPSPAPRKIAGERVKVAVKGAVATGSTGFGAALKKLGLRIAMIALATVGLFFKASETPVKLFAEAIGRRVTSEGFSARIFRTVAHLRREIVKIEGSSLVQAAFKKASSAAERLNARDSLASDAIDKLKEARAGSGAEKEPDIHRSRATQLASSDPKLAAFVLARGELEATSAALAEISIPDGEVATTLSKGRADFRGEAEVTVAQVPKGIEGHTTKAMMKARVKPLSGNKHFKAAFKEEGLSAMNARATLSGLDKLGPKDQSWRAYTVSPQGSTALADSVCPTSSRTKFEVAGLHNAYVNVVALPDGTKQFNITTGVIDTKAKADAFVAIIKAAVAENPGVKTAPLHISMHQLNSFMKESGLIECEHAMASYIQSQLRSGEDRLEGALVTHENTSFNAFTKFPLRENARCSAMNTEAAAAQLLMLPPELTGVSADVSARLGEALEQVQSAYADALNYSPDDYPQLSTLQGEIDGLQGKLDGALGDLAELDPSSAEYTAKMEEAGQLQADIQVLEQTQGLAEQKIIEDRVSVMSSPSHARGNLSADLSIAFGSLETRKTELRGKLAELGDAAPPELRKEYAQVAALHAKIGAVTGQLKMSQGAKVLMQHVADVAMGSVSQANCKSGLDRTGMARALFATVDKMIQDGVPIDKVVDFVSNIDEHTSNVNASLDKAFKSAPKEQDEKTTLKEALNSLKPEEKWAFNFQSNNFTSLLEVGLPITARSTGLAGTKWHHEGGGIDANPHPGPMLPRFVLDSDGTVQRLVQTNGIMTKYGVQVLSGGSALRGG